MDKTQVIHAITETLNGELSALTAAALAAYQAATDSESRAEDQYDTRGLEASYLAGAQAERVATLKRMIAMYKYLPVQSVDTDSPITPGTLVELESAGKRTHYFLVGQGGGISVQIQGRSIQVITPAAPLGEALLGRRAGETFDLEVRGSLREYRVVSLS